MLAMASITRFTSYCRVACQSFCYVPDLMKPYRKKYNGSKLGVRGGRDIGQYLPKYLIDHFRLNNP